MSIRSKHNTPEWDEHYDKVFPKNADPTIFDDVDIETNTELDAQEKDAELEKLADPEE